MNQASPRSMTTAPAIVATVTAGVRLLATDSEALDSNALLVSLCSGVLLGCAENVCRRCRTALTSPSLGSVWERSMKVCDALTNQRISSRKILSTGWRHYDSWKYTQAPQRPALLRTDACITDSIGGLYDGRHIDLLQANWASAHKRPAREQ